MTKLYHHLSNDAGRFTVTRSGDVELELLGRNELLAEFSTNFGTAPGQSFTYQTIVIPKRDRAALVELLKETL